MRHIIETQGFDKLSKEDQNLVLKATYSSQLIGCKNTAMELKAVIDGVKNGTIELTEKYQWFSARYRLTQNSIKTMIMPEHIPIFPSNKMNRVECCCEDDCDRSDDYNEQSIAVCIRPNTIQMILESEYENLQKQIDELTEKLNNL